MVFGSLPRLGVVMMPALNQLAGYYKDGMMGLLHDFDKATELLLLAGELGCAAAYTMLAMLTSME